VGNSRTLPRSSWNCAGVVTFSKFPAIDSSHTYQAWALHDGVWVSLGDARPDAAGSARIITEGENLTTLPQALQVTVEPQGGSQQPSGAVVARWPNE